MKLFGKQIGGSKAPVVPTEKTNTGGKGMADKSGMQQFTSPFLTVGEGNLAMPYVSTSYRKGTGYVRFGDDNLFPNLLRQLKYTSPLHGNIMKFINNATVGGSYSFKNTSTSGRDKVSLYNFENVVGLEKLLPQITQDALMFESIQLLITNDESGKPIRVKRIPLDELRWDEETKIFTYNKDFSREIGSVLYSKYITNKANHTGILQYRMDDGDMFYPIPLYTSANNWIFLDGESSYLHKSNILESVFASTVFKFPRKPASDEEALEYKKTIESLKGANGKKTIAFFEQGVDNLPIIERLATTNNDKLFLQTDERVDAKICQAWGIDPMLMGIRVSGKLGSGSDIQQSYIIFEKNTIMPLRRDIEEVINDLMQLFGVKGEFSINNYQIINETIVEVEGEDSASGGDEDSFKEIRSSVGGITALMQLQQSVAAGTTSRSSALGVLKLIYGFSPEEAIEILGDVEEGSATAPDNNKFKKD
jgi:hypothetical protein